MSSLPRRPTIVSVSSPSLKSNSVGIPRTAYRSGIVGFSSTFSLATVARPSNSVASASTVGASRRQGPHHSAQKSTSTTPLFFSSSKLLSVNVLTFSDAIRYLLPLSLNPHAACCALVNVNVLPCRCIPREIQTHPCLLDASPKRSVAKRGQRSLNRTEERRRRVLDESKAGAPARLRVYIEHRIVQPTRGPDDRDRPISQAVHLIQAAWLESGRHQENVRTALDEMCQRLIEPNPRRDHRRVPRRQIAPHILVSMIASAEHDKPGAKLRQLIHYSRDEVETLLIDHPRDHADERPAAVFGLGRKTVAFEELPFCCALSPQL